MKEKQTHVKIGSEFYYDEDYFTPQTEVVGEFDTYSDAEEFAREHGMKLGLVAFSQACGMEGWTLIDDSIYSPLDPMHYKEIGLWGEDVSVFRYEDEDDLKEFFFSEIEYGADDMDDVETIVEDYREADSALYRLDDGEAILIKAHKLWKQNVRVEDCAYMNDFDGHEFMVVAYKE